MSDADIVLNCSPTLAGLKTGNLFGQYFDSYDEMMKTVRSYNLRLSPYSILMVPVAYRLGRALLYVYRPQMLKRSISDPRALAILREAGYTDPKLKCHVAQLCNRLADEACYHGSFPHEIGLFLGYPPEDVRGFIDNNADRCKIVGTWKVYGDAEAAQKKFVCFRRCTNDYCKRVQNGAVLEQLINRI